MLKHVKKTSNDLLTAYEAHEKNVKKRKRNSQTTTITALWSRRTNSIYSQLHPIQAQLERTKGLFICKEWNSFCGVKKFWIIEMIRCANSAVSVPSCAKTPERDSFAAKHQIEKHNVGYFYDGTSYLSSCGDRVESVVSCTHLGLLAPLQTSFWAQILSTSLSKAIGPDAQHESDLSLVSFKHVKKWTKRRGKGANACEDKCKRARLPPKSSKLL